MARRAGGGATVRLVLARPARQRSRALPRGRDRRPQDGRAAHRGEQALVNLAGPASLTDVVLPSLVNDVAALSRPFVLVLDDYHVISNPRIHEAVTFLLDHQPDTLQLAVATRSEPPMPLGRLRVRREVVEVRASELRFTDETPEERLLSGETRGVILTAIERLSPAQRLVV